MSPIYIDTHMGFLRFGENHFWLTNQYGLVISDILFVNNCVFIRAWLKDELNNKYDVHNVNNVFALNDVGNLLWQKGRRAIDFMGKSVDVPASNMNYEDDCIKLYYQSHHEVWLDPQTGEVVKEDYVVKR